MQIKLCMMFVACVIAHPIKQEKETAGNKSHKKYDPTVADVKALEKEIWKATSLGDLSKALKLENRLEADILRAAIIALTQSKIDPVRSKRDLQQLGSIVRRDKRTIKFLSSVFATGAQTGLGLLLGHNKIEGASPENKALIRIPRQGKYNTFPRHPSQISRRNDIELSNDILPPPAPTSSTRTTTFNISDVDITSTIAPDNVVSTTTVLNDAVTAGTNREELTPRAPARQEEVTSRTPARQEEEDEDEGGGGLGGLITSFLGSLSTPEGGVDLDAVTGLLGGISAQNDDGSFDFTGLQDTVGSLFGGSEEGGSNVGLFLGGLIGAIVRGSAGDDAAKGAGRLAANILSALLPGLSAYPTPEDDEDAKPHEGLDSGGFLKGFLSTIAGSLGGLSDSNSSGGHSAGDKPGVGPLLQIKFKLFRSIFSLISKILSSSSSSKQAPAYGNKNGGQYYGPPPPQ